MILRRIGNKNFLRTLQTWTNSISPFHQPAKDWYPEERSFSKYSNLVFWPGKASSMSLFKIWNKISFYLVIQTFFNISNLFLEPQRPSNDDQRLGWPGDETNCKYLLKMEFHILKWPYLGGLKIICISNPPFLILCFF